MRLHRRTAAVATTGVALALAATACGSSGKSNAGGTPSAAKSSNLNVVTGKGGFTFAGTKGGTLYVLDDSDFGHLDPARNYVTNSLDMGRMIYRSLNTYKGGPGQAGEAVVPDMATNTGDKSDGGKTWTFHLKPGLKYEDGSAITTADIKYGVERTFAPELPEGPAYMRTLLAGADAYKGPYKDPKGIPSIVTPDANTIVFHFAKPFGDFDQAATLSIFAPVPKAKDTKTSYDNRPFSSGPYKIATYQRGKELDLVRNMNWDGSTDPAIRAYPDKIVQYQSLSDAEIDQRLIADNGNDSSAIQLSTIVQPENVAKVLTNSAVKGRSVTGFDNSSNWVALDTKKSPTNSLQVRQAIEYAWNSQTYLTAAGGQNFGLISHSVLVPTLTAHQNFNLYPSPNDQGDITKARQLLAQAGFAKGVKVSYAIINKPRNIAEGETVKAALARAGITVNLVEVPKGPFYDIIGTPAKSTNLAGYGWIQDWPSASTIVPPLFKCNAITPSGNQNIPQLCDKTIDAASDAASAETDKAKADTMWGNLDKQIMEQAPLVPTFYGKQIILHGSKVKNAYPFYPAGGAFDLANLAVQ